MKNTLLFWMLAVLLIMRPDAFAHAAMVRKTIEITPYVWLAGVDADITVGDRTGEIDVGFDDLADYVDTAGGLLLNIIGGRWLGWLQGDFLSLDSDNEATRFDELGTLEIEMTILEAAVGYQFPNPLAEEAVVDVLVGVRYTDIENTFDAATGRSFEADHDLLDPMLVLRPWFPITENLAFNPTLAIGGGDSDLIYELQPQILYQFADHFGLRVGYRRLYYDVKGDRGELDGAIHGLLAGLSMRF